MNNSERAKVIVISVLLSFLAFLFFGRLVGAKISTLPVLNRLKILSPQAPIVINNHEQVRVSDTADVMDAVNSVKSKISVIAIVDDKNNVLSMAGSAVNLTTDGIFVAPETVFSQKGAAYYIILADGRTSPLVSTTIDPATGLVFAKADISNVAVAPFAGSKNLNPGEKLVLINNTTIPYAPRIEASFVATAQSNVENMVFDADHPSRSFSAQTTGDLLPGQVAVNTNGEVVGVWGGKSIISSDVLKSAANVYLNNSGKITRPSFGFTYMTITAADSGLLHIPEGARVVSVLHAGKAGTLMAGDIITSADGQAVNSGNPLEVLLEKYKPGDTMNVSVTRGANALQIAVPVTELK